MNGEQLTRGELTQIETRLRATVISLNKRDVTGITMLEAVDEAVVWPDGLQSLKLKHEGIDLEHLITRFPLLVCAIASEIGFAYEGVGTTFWAHFDTVTGETASVIQRQRVADIFQAAAERYGLSRPSPSAFSEHFSNIAGLRRRRDEFEVGAPSSALRCCKTPVWLRV